MNHGSDLADPIVSTRDVVETFRVYGVPPTGGLIFLLRSERSKPFRTMSRHTAPSPSSPGAYGCSSTRDSSRTVRSWTRCPSRSRHCFR